MFTSLFFFCISFFANGQMSRSDLQSLNSYCDCEQTFLHSDTSTEQQGGFKILKTGYQMAMVNKTIIRGSCWDFVNEVYNRSGFATAKKTVFSSRKGGPYAASTLVQPGDWIYHVNHQYNNIEHSAIFICWKDFSKRIGITLSYAGGNRSVPAKFGEYQLNNIYSIFRAPNEECK
jgi:hypothetical protein